MKRVLPILALLICCTLTLMAQNKSKSKAHAKSSTKATAAVHVPAIDLTALDKKVDPCIDFYEYACGNWRKSHPIPADKSRFGSFDKLADSNILVLKGLLEKASHTSAKRTPVEAKVGDFYAACMDEKTIEAKGATPLQSWLDRINAINSTADLMKTAGALRREGEPAIFTFGAASDLKDSNMTRAQADQGGTTLPDRDNYLGTDKKSVEMREKYVQHITNMFKLWGDNDDKAAAEAKTILSLETDLATAQMDRIKRRDPRSRDHRMTLAALEQMAPNFDFNDYLQAEGAPSFTELNVGNPDFFKAIDPKIQSIPLDDWKTYLRWRVLTGAAPTLSSKFVSENFDFGGRYMRGAKEEEPRWKRCVRFTDRSLGEALGQLYVAKAFGPNDKARMKKMVDALTASLEQDIKDLPWMTDATKKRALEKLAAFNRTKVGYPDKWRDYSSVRIARDDFFGNMEHAIQFEANRRVSKIGKPVDRAEWGMTPPTVNAYYNPPNNEIVFPAGILQPPFFNKDADDAVNFGGVGLVIGHELTHGFDDQGRKYDPQGNLNDWWTDADAKAFEERASCVADEYTGFVSVKDPANGDVHLKGRLTLGENTADNGGARVAYNALENTLKGKPVKKIDGFTPEQRFFLGFAEVWCQNATDASLRLSAQTDPHSPGEFRVNGTVGNMPEFQKAFSCKAGSPMVHSNACRVW